MVHSSHVLSFNISITSFMVLIRAGHFHFTSAIYKKLCELGLKISYGTNKNFKKWTRMIMAFPFLKIDDIDECWEELNDEMDLGDELENKKFDQFRKYLNDTWMSATATFNRTIWNFHDDENTRTSSYLIFKKSQILSYNIDLDQSKQWIS